MVKEKIAIFWFRRDLRLNDNAGLYHSLKSEFKILPIFIFDKNILDKVTNKNLLREDYSVKKSFLEFIVVNKKIPAELISIIPKEITFHSFLGDMDILSDAKDNKEIESKIHKK